MTKPTVRVCVIDCIKSSGLEIPELGINKTRCPFRVQTKVSVHCNLLDTAFPQQFSNGDLPVKSRTNGVEDKGKPKECLLQKAQIVVTEEPYEDLDSDDKICVRQVSGCYSSVKFYKTGKNETDGKHVRVGRHPCPFCLEEFLLAKCLITGEDVSKYLHERGQPCNCPLKTNNILVY